jgi:predicted nucleic acid-binding protein
VWIREAIASEGPLGWTDPILYELTAGARSTERADELRALLLRGPMLAVAGLQDWEDAARLHRTARSRGLTVRSTIDCLIAAMALRTTSFVLARDRDFGALAAVSNLELVEP